MSGRTVESRRFHFSEFGDPSKSRKVGHSKATMGIYALFRVYMEGGAIVLLFADPKNLTEQSS